MFALRSEARAKREWEKYAACSTLPDPADQADLNSFLTMQRGELDPSSLDFNKAVEICDANERVVAQVLTYAAKLREDGGSPQALAELEQTVVGLRDLTLSLLDRVTLNYVRQSDELIDERGIIQLQCLRGDIKYALWILYPDEGEKVTVTEIDFEDIGVALRRLPMSLRLSTVGIRIVQLKYDQLSRSSSRPLPFVAVGGVFLFQQVSIPDQARRLRGWMRKDCSAASEGLTMLKYPSDGKDTGLSDIVVKFKIPDTLYLDGTTKPLVGWWDSENKCWRTDGLREKDTKLDLKTRVLTIKVWRMEPFAMLQPRALDFPYKAWALVRNETEPGAVDLTLRGSRFNVVIRATAGGVQLLSPVLPQFSGVMKAGELLLRLKDAGINVAPSNEDAAFCKKPIKDKKVEARVYRGIASVAGVFDVCGSRYSSTQGPDAALVKVRECGWTPPEPPAEEAKEEDQEPPKKLSKKELKALAKQQKLEEEKRLADEAAAKEHQELMDIITGETVDDKKIKAISDDADGWRTVLATRSKWAFIKSSRYHLRERIIEDAEGLVSHASLGMSLAEAYPGKVKALGGVETLLQETVRGLLNLVRVAVFH